MKTPFIYLRDENAAMLDVDYYSFHCLAAADCFVDAAVDFVIEQANLPRHAAADSDCRFLDEQELPPEQTAVHQRRPPRQLQPSLSEI